MGKFLTIILILLAKTICAQRGLDSYNVIWNSQSANSSASMPCGGGDIGLNVWVEKGELLFYMSQSGSFDENNQFLKSGRVRVTMSPNPFAGKTFRQELILKDGYIKLNGSNGKLTAEVNIWVDVFNQTIHVEVNANQKINCTAAYESWRHEDRLLKGREARANSWKWASGVKVVTTKDSVRCDYKGEELFFFHDNKDSSVFDVTVKQQKLDSVKDSLLNPFKFITGRPSAFYGRMQGKNMIVSGTYTGAYLETAYKGWKLTSRSVAKKHRINILLGNTLFPWGEHNLYGNENLANWEDKLPWQKTKDWWHQYWNRSFININTEKTDSLAWQAERNYQLFRYMLGCNAYGKYPTKFNGGLFTYDPVFSDSSVHGTPDYRNWGGGTFTAQNQRLVYWPMLKSGDIDMMKPQFDFYKNILKTAELRSKIYWNHAGACFTEQLENFGLPNMAEYGFKRPQGFDPGLEYNAWLEYEWDTVLEFCMMILETETYQNKNISEYIPLIESCLVFFDEHYQYLAKKRGVKALDGNGHLVLYPGSGGETFKMANNSTSTIAALQTVTKKLLQSNFISDSSRAKFTGMRQRIPPISFGNYNGHPTIAPAKTWERVNNVEPTQLYPVFPWGMYGVGKSGLDTAINTWRYDTFALKFRSAVGWKQDNIWSARLGLTKEAAELNTAKMKNSGGRFPAFWGPGFDWTPDHNWGGSGMIGMQEMLMQTDDKKILLFPAWPKEWDVHFKLHAPYKTTVEIILKDGKIQHMEILPKERAVDVINMLK